MLALLIAMSLGFQSTRPVRGGTFDDDDTLFDGEISIHPPRAGRDEGYFCAFCYKLISIHPPRAGRDW